MVGQGDDASTKRGRLRRAAPSGAGPLGSSGAAPEQDAEPAAAPGETAASSDPVDGAPPQKGDSGATTGGAGVGTAVRRRLRGRLPSRAALTRAARTTRAWANRPLGRLVVPGVLGAFLLGAAGGLGAYLVPTVWAAAPSPAAQEVPPAPATILPSAAPGIGPAPAGPVGGVGVSATPSTPVTGGRPADALNGWATLVSAKVGIPVTAMQAYGYAELVAARTLPNCRLSWTTLAAIGKVESAHGSALKASLGPDGQALPAIKGLPLDGQGGRMLIKDTDRGVLDGDPTFDRAMGPMQFIPTTWQETAIDADNNGVTDPNDIDDAALAAANYLCKGGRDMSTSEDWWAAILSYNDVQRYAQDVFNSANDYGTRSRT